MGHRRDVKATILALLDDRGEITSRDIQAAAGLTRQAVHHHISEMIRTGVVERIGRGRATRYRLPDTSETSYPIDGLAEDRVWSELLASEPRLRSVNHNATSILRFSFTESLNNAVEHSRGTQATVASRWPDGQVSFEVRDDGVGAFRTVQEKFELPDLFAAVQEISKGKITTDPQHHTGQGIFFTSKAVDHYTLEANGLRWRVDNIRGDQAVADSPLTKGTRAAWDLATDTARTLKSIFDAYTNPDTYEFSRSRATVRLFESQDVFVSRSEAKRLLHGLERFEEVEIDLRGVIEVGQGFVDEVFRVWAGEHPGTELTPVNMSPAVEAMVRRGLPPRPR